VLGAFFLVLWLGLGLLFSITWGGGELGSYKEDQLGAYEDFTVAAPLVIRVMTATSDPAMDPAQPTNHFERVGVEVTMPQGFSYVAKRLDGDHLVDLHGLGGDRFGDDFPSECRIEKCARTYVLVACWNELDGGAGRGAFMGASIRASPDETKGGSVSLFPAPELLPHDMAVDLAKSTGCEGHA